MQIGANGISLEYTETGPKDGPAMILIRGLGTQSVHWPQEFVQGLADLGYRVICFDNRDVGLSQRCPADGVAADADTILAQIKAGVIPKPAYLPEDMALDVIGLMDALGIARAHIFGISMGGLIAQLLAIHHSDRLLSDTIVMTAALLRSPDLLAGLLAYPQTCAQAQDSAIAGHKAWGSHDYPMTETAIRAEAAAAWARSPDVEGVNRQVLAIMNGTDIRDALTAVDLPCLVIHGAIDTLVPPEGGRAIAALIPNAELEIIQGMGHFSTPLLAPIIIGKVHDFITRRGR